MYAYETEVQAPRRRSSRRRRRRRRRRLIRATVLCLAAVLLGGAYLHRARLRQLVWPEHLWSSPAPGEEAADSAFRRSLADFAREHGLTLEDWPEELVELGEKNPEAEDFVRNYPLNKDKPQVIDLSGELDGGGVPLLFQWDQRWGYAPYSGGLLGVTGCGPLCLSMVSLYLLQDASYTPQYMAQFSTENGYSVEGNGSAWTLFSEGGPKLGLDVVELPLDEERIIRNLEAGNPIVCVMGPGDFTTTGHYIVMSGYEEGKIRVNDPNSKSRSETLWPYAQIQDQIRNLWVCRRG